MNILPYYSRDTHYKYPFGAVKTGCDIRFTIKPECRFTVSQAFLVLQKDDGQPFKIPFRQISSDGTNDTYSCCYTPEKSGLYWYYFQLETGEETLFIRNAGNGKGEISVYRGDSFQLTVYSAFFTTPEWMKGGIIYQIFPDRFCREGILPENVPADRRLRSDWGGMVDYQSLDNNTNANNDYFCGNLKGITSKLSYLASLGISAIYLNPIFEAHSNHRYNTADYMKIDPLLGNEGDFKTLCMEAGRYHIRIILDGVFNHTGADSIYFNKYGRYGGQGAYQSLSSCYTGWYNFIRWPQEYRSWWGIDSLPETNKTNEAFLDYILGDTGVLVHWLQAGAGGWRLDVADELPTYFLDSIRRTIKNENPEAVIIGEVWEDASNKISYSERRHYLEGYELDSVMNYPLKEAVIHFIKNHNAEDLNNCIMAILENYPKPVTDVLMNILGTHDTARIITRLRGESSEGKDRTWKAHHRLSEEEKQKGLRDVAIVAAILYFLPGIPCIYYGDETGMEGYEDPFNRGCFPWNETQSRLTDWFIRLGNIRRSSPVLKEGEYTSLSADNGFFSFLRSGSPDPGILCAVNLGEKPQNVIIPDGYKEIKLLADLNDDVNGSDITVQPDSCKIYNITSTN